MKAVFVFWALAAGVLPISGFPAEDNQSVVSVYTTQPTTAGTASLDVYHQIANNIAEKITSPIYRFLGLAKNKTDTPTPTPTPTTRSISNVELLDDDIKTVRPINNDISTDRDVEPLSNTKSTQTKPEKITLYSSYLPSQKIEATTEYKSNNSTQNKTINEVNVDDDDEPFEFDEVQKPRGSIGGPFVYFLELLGSVFQLAWGAIQSLFSLG